MSWIVDNAIVLYVLFGVVAVGLLLVWRNNRQTKYLGFTAGAVVLVGLVWLATHYYVSDKKQLENNVNAMADAVQAGKVDELFKYISKDFDHKGITREKLYEEARQSIQRNQIKSVHISNFNVDEVSRSQRTAKTRFRVSASGAGERTFIFVTQADFVLEGDQWKLKAVRFYNPLVNQDQEIGVPGL